MTASNRPVKLVATVLLSLLALAGCNFEVENSPFGNSSSDSATESTAETASRSVSLYWSAPMQRLNGEDITTDDLGGYEIRYRKESESSYTRIVIDNPAVDQYHIDDIDSDDYRFEVAAFDQAGLYSDFVVAAR
jgi:hypothetical protein